MKNPMNGPHAPDRVEFSDELDELVIEILNLVQNHKISSSMSALNYVMATLIYLHFNGAESALRHCDEATRYVLSQMRSDSGSNRLN